MPEPWERLPRESDPAFAGFVAYRDAGPQRSLRSVAQTLHKAPTTLAQWSKRHEWQVRIAAYDNWKALQTARAEADEESRQRRAMVRLHAQTSRAIVNLIARRVVGDEASGVKALDPNTLDAQDIARLLDIAVKTERLSRGVSTENVELHQMVEDVRRLAADRGFTTEETEEAIAEAQRLVLEG